MLNLVGEIRGGRDRWRGPGGSYNVLHTKSGLYGMYSATDMLADVDEELPHLDAVGSQHPRWDYSTQSLLLWRYYSCGRGMESDSPPLAIG